MAESKSTFTPTDWSMVMVELSWLMALPLRFRVNPVCVAVKSPSQTATGVAAQTADAAQRAHEPMMDAMRVDMNYLPFLYPNTLAHSARTTG